MITNDMMTNDRSHLDPASEALTEKLIKDPDYRVLRALPKPTASMPDGGAPPAGRCIALLDVETTSLDAANGKIIEIAIKLLWVDDEGKLLGHLPIYSGLEDPGHALDPIIAQLTQLRNSDLIGQKIDDEMVGRLLDRADLIVAHNARFDCQWVLQRWPDLSDKPWACSCVELPWQGLGFEGRSQPLLLQQHGWFTRAHRASDDVWALFCLLMQVWPDQQSNHRDDPAAGQSKQRSHLQRLLEASDNMTVRVEAVGGSFSKKDQLRARGYRWDAHMLRKVWWREIAATDVEAERLWLQHLGLPLPRLVPITARERHR